VNFQYAYAGDMENGYDFAKTIISVNGVETVLKQYTGTVERHRERSDHRLPCTLAGVGRRLHHQVPLPERPLVRRFRRAECDHVRRFRGG
jgi:hypothetical protein